jgi:hypothetical protein
MSIGIGFLAVPSRICYAFICLATDSTLLPIADACADSNSSAVTFCRKATLKKVLNVT